MNSDPSLTLPCTNSNIFGLVSSFILHPFPYTHSNSMVVSAEQRMPKLLAVTPNNRM